MYEDTIVDVRTYFKSKETFRNYQSRREELRTYRFYIDDVPPQTLNNNNVKVVSEFDFYKPWVIDSSGSSS